jgi:hypothetical protein
MPDLSLNSPERSATKTGVSVKLYLSSYHLCKEPSRLSALSAKNRRVAIIRNALDIYTDTKRLREGLEREAADMEAIGLLGEHFKTGAMRPSSEFPTPVRFAFPDTSERRSPGVGY